MLYLLKYAKSIRVVNVLSDQDLSGNLDSIRATLKRLQLTFGRNIINHDGLLKAIGFMTYRKDPINANNKPKLK